MALVDTIRTTLGPRGMDKLIHDDKVQQLPHVDSPGSQPRPEPDLALVLLQGTVTISNDGATIMKLLDVVHPAAKTLVDVSLSQDAEV
jgi:T-complex protein 1 subunit eta